MSFSVYGSYSPQHPPPPPLPPPSPATMRTLIFQVQVHCMSVCVNYKVKRIAYESGSTDTEKCFKWDFTEMVAEEGRLRECCSERVNCLYTCRRFCFRIVSSSYLLLTVITRRTFFPTLFQSNIEFSLMCVLHNEDTKWSLCNLLCILLSDRQLREEVIIVCRFAGSKFCLMHS